jgi:hypothetical protein
MHDARPPTVCIEWFSVFLYSALMGYCIFLDWIFHFHSFLCLQSGRDLTISGTVCVGRSKPKPGQKSVTAVFGSSLN